MTADLIVADTIPDAVYNELAKTFAVFPLGKDDADGRIPEAARASRFILAGSDNHNNRMIGADIIEQLPKLELIAGFGVGYDRIDTGEARRRGVVVTNTPSVHDEEVADFAMGLLIATLREIPRADNFVRSGRWAEGTYPLSRGTLRGRKLGIVGLGRIGLAFARRAESFGLSIAYHNRRARGDVRYEYHGSIQSLAEAVDTLLISVPGGDATMRLVGGDTLDRLGPAGVVINIARGSVLDEAALVDALRHRRILAAGLDVHPCEPNVSEEMLAFPNVILQPHIASASIYTRQEMWRLAIENLLAWRAGRGPINPVRETPWPVRSDPASNSAFLSNMRVDHA